MISPRDDDGDGTTCLIEYIGDETTCSAPMLDVPD